MRELTKKAFKDAYRKIQDVVPEEFHKVFNGLLASFNLTLKKLKEDSELNDKILKWVCSVGNEDYYKARAEYRRKNKGKTQMEIFRERLIAQGIIKG